MKARLAERLLGIPAEQFSPNSQLRNATDTASKCLAPNLNRIARTLGYGMPRRGGVGAGQGREQDSRMICQIPISIQPFGCTSQAGIAIWE